MSAPSLASPARAAARPHISGYGAAPVRALQVSLPGLLAFIAGCAHPVKLNLLGELYGSEAALPIAALAAVAMGGARVLRSRALRLLGLALFATLVGYIVSDVAVGSRPDQYLRGWGRILVLALDLLCLALLAGHRRANLWWFVAGLGLGGVAYLRLVLHQPLPMWKFGYAEPMLLVAASAGCLLPRRLNAGWFALLGVLSMRYDFRSFSVLCFALAGYVWLRAGRPNAPMRGMGQMLRMALVAAAVVGASWWLLDSTEGGTTSGRRAHSDAGRRAAIEVGAIAIAQSPVVGYGSWTENAQLARMYTERYLTYMDAKGYYLPAGTFFTPHSQILQSWVEGGVLGASFFVVLLYQLIARALPVLSVRRPLDWLSALLLYYAFGGIWNILMSPFAAPHRIGLALACMVVLVIDLERARRAPRARPIHGLAASRVSTVARTEAA